MGGETPDSDDLDLALDSLEAELDDVSDEVSEVDEASEAEATPAAASPASMPPRLPTSRGAPASLRRTPFDDLFATDSAPTAAVKGSPDEKIEYFRGKLKQAEQVIARVREAWGVREKEMDGLEAAAVEATRATTEAVRQRTELEQFFTRKKTEFQEYIEKVTKAFSEKDDTEQTLRGELENLRGVGEQQRADMEGTRVELEQDMLEAVEQLDQLKADLEIARQEGRDTREALEHDIQVRDEAIAKLKEMLETQRTALAERDEEIERQLDASAEQSRAVAQAVAEKERSERALRANAAQAKDEHYALEEVRGSLEGEIAARDQNIEELTATGETLRRDLRERENATTELRAELDSAAAEATHTEKQLRAEIATLQLAADAESGAQSADVEKLNRELEARQETIEQLRGLVDEQKHAATARETELATQSAAVEKLKREAIRLREQVVQQDSPARGDDGAKTVRLRKALALADRLFLDLAAGYPNLLSPEQPGGEMLGRLRKAVALARKASELL